MLEIPLRGFPFQTRSFETEDLCCFYVLCICQRISFEKEMPSGGSLAENGSQSCSPRPGGSAPRPRRSWHRRPWPRARRRPRRAPIGTCAGGGFKILDLAQNNMAKTPLLQHRHNLQCLVVWNHTLWNHPLRKTWAWVFRDVVFQDAGFQNTSFKPLAHISCRCEVPTPSVFEGQ